MLMRCFLHSKQTKRFLRKNIAWGHYFELNLCLLVLLLISPASSWVQFPANPVFNLKAHVVPGILMTAFASRGSTSGGGPLGDLLMWADLISGLLCSGTSRDTARR